MESSELKLLQATDKYSQNLNRKSDSKSFDAIAIKEIGRYENGIYNEGAAEIIAHVPETQCLFLVNANDVSVDILDIKEPTKPRLINSINISEFGGSANSVDVNNGVVVVAVESEDTPAPGSVVFFDIKGKFLSSVKVGALPDMLTFTPNEKKVLVANEGEPSDDYTIDPQGSVSIIDISKGVANLTQEQVTNADFTTFNEQEAVLKAAGVRIFGLNATLAEDLEPEYITVSGNSTTAWVSLQENNALANVDILAGKVREILPLGYKPLFLRLPQQQQKKQPIRTGAILYLLVVAIARMVVTMIFYSLVKTAAISFGLLTRNCLITNRMQMYWALT